MPPFRHGARSLRDSSVPLKAQVCTAAAPNPAGPCQQTARTPPKPPGDDPRAPSIFHLSVTTHSATCGQTTRQRPQNSRQALVQLSSSVEVSRSQGPGARRPRGPRRGPVTAEPAWAGPAPFLTRLGTQALTLDTPRTGMLASLYLLAPPRDRCPEGVVLKPRNLAGTLDRGAGCHLPPASLLPTSQQKPFSFLRSRRHHPGSGADQATGDGTRRPAL